MGHYSPNLRKSILFIALTLAISASQSVRPSEGRTEVNNFNCSESKLHGNVSAKTEYWHGHSENDPKRQKRSPFVHEFPREALYGPPPPPPPFHHNFHYSNDYGTDEGSYNRPRFHSPPPPRFRRPPPPSHRRFPASRYGLPSPPRRVVMPGGGQGRPIPLPRPAHSPRRIPHAKPSYSYPKNAANIQDILSYFQKEDTGHSNHGYRPRPSPASPDMSQVSMGGDFSKELRDVQTSLLKDIREFAQRPNLMHNSYTERPLATPTTIPPPIRSSSYNYDMRLQIDEDADDQGEPKAKPVRDMIKPVSLPRPSYRPKSRQNGWSVEDSREDRPKSRIRDRYRDEDEGQEHARAHPNHASRERRPSKFGKDSDHHSGKNRYPPEEESEEVIEQEAHKDDIRRNRPRIKPNTEQYHRYVGGKYKNDDKAETSDELDSRKRYRNHRYADDWKEEQRSSSETPSRQNIKVTSPKPIVLKKPYGPYKSVPEAIEQVERPGILPAWGSLEKQRSESADVFSPSTTLYRNKYRRPVPIQEVDEDIVEIHTGEPTYKPTQEPPLHFREEEPERKDHLHKLYLEYLERKLEAETMAAVTATNIPPSPYKPYYHAPPPPPPSTKLSPPPPPMRMKIHIYPNENADGPTASGGREQNYKYHRPTVVLPPRNVYSTPPPQYPMPPQPRYPTSYSNFNQRMDSYALPGPVPSPKGIYVAGHTNQQEGQKGGPSTGIDKNKNLVLHLHVHRRTDGGGDSLAGASEIHTSTVKPLTYKEIYDQVQEEQQHQLEQRKGYASAMGADASADPANKSLSVELPLQEERIQDVLHSILKYRERQ